MKNLSRINFWFVASISYIITRLINYKIIPIFTDEAIYSFWALVALHDPANRFISLEDGKQPLFIWIAAVFQHFVRDPLIATRLVSTAAGFGSMIGIYFLGKELFNDKVAKISAILYVILPFTLLYDRLALYDSLLTMLGIYAVLFSIKLAKNLNLDSALLSGSAISLAMITKSSGNFFLYLLPFSLVFFDFKKTKLPTRIFRWITLATLTFILTQIIYNSLRLSPLFYIIERKNTEFVRSFSEVLHTPLTSFLSQSTTIVGWLISYLGPFMFIVFIVGVFYGLYQKNKAIVYLTVLVTVPFFAESTFNKILYPRFLLFYFPYIILICAYLIQTTFVKYAQLKGYLFILYFFILLIPVTNSFKLLTNPPSADIAQSDKNQYLNDWPAGYGVTQVVNYLKNVSGDNQVYIGTEGTFGLFPYALSIYFYNNPNIHVFAYWPVDPQNLPSQIVDFSQKNKTFFIFNFTQKEITNPYLKLIDKYQKGTGNSYMRLYEINQF